MHCETAQYVWGECSGFWQHWHVQQQLALGAQANSLIGECTCDMLDVCGGVVNVPRWCCRSLPIPSIQTFR
jgi:hypothetical protein